MAITGQRRKRYRKHNFLVDVEGIIRAGFVTCSELKPSVEIIEHREGTDIEPEKLPGNANIENLTLTWGTSDDLDFWEWFSQVVNFRKQGGLTDDLVIRSVEIQQLDRDNTVALRYPIDEAFPTEFSFGDWDKNANELNIRTVTLAIRGLGDPVRG